MLKLPSEIILSLIYFIKRLLAVVKFLQNQDSEKKNQIHILQFWPTFSMLVRKGFSPQKSKKHLCCNLFWVLQQFDLTRRHKDLSTRKSDIYRGRRVEVNISLKMKPITVLLYVI